MSRALRLTGWLALATVWTAAGAGRSEVAYVEALRALNEGRARHGVELLESLWKEQPAPYVALALGVANYRQAEPLAATDWFARAAREGGREVRRRSWLNEARVHYEAARSSLEGQRAESLAASRRVLLEGLRAYPEDPLWAESLEALGALRVSRAAAGPAAAREGQGERGAGEADSVTGSVAATSGEEPRGTGGEGARIDREGGQRRGLVAESFAEFIARWKPGPEEVDRLMGVLNEAERRRRALQVGAAERPSPGKPNDW